MRWQRSYGYGRPKNLPKLGSAIGKTVRNVREGMEGTDETDTGVSSAETK